MFARSWGRGARLAAAAPFKQSSFDGGRVGARFAPTLNLL